MPQLTASEVLKAVADREALLPTIRVEDRLLEQEKDLGNLLGWDENKIDSLASINPNEAVREEYLTNLARDNTQLLFNTLWTLPTERVDEALCIKLPPPSYQLPREKPIPKPKPPTKWEAFAKSKGIDKKSKKAKGGEQGRGRLVWDDQVREWVPRFGYKKAQAEQQKTWMMEIKDNADPMEDPFEKEIEAKRERVAKNEIQRLRNMARAQKVKIPGSQGLAPPPTGKDMSQNTGSDLKKAADLAKKSTASLGKFQGKLSNKLEKSSVEAAKKIKGPKRKFDPVISQSGEEKERNLRVLDLITSKKPKLDINKAVGRQLNKEDADRQEEKTQARGKGTGKGKGVGGKGSSGKGKRDGKSHFKNRGGGKNYGKGKKGTGKAAKGKGGGKSPR